MKIFESVLKIEYESRCFKDIKVGEYFEYNNDLYIKTHKICSPDHWGDFATKLTTGIMYSLNPNAKVIPVNIEICYSKHKDEIQFNEHLECKTEKWINCYDAIYGKGED